MARIETGQGLEAANEIALRHARRAMEDSSTQLRTGGWRPRGVVLIESGGQQGDSRYSSQVHVWLDRESEYEMSFYTFVVRLGKVVAVGDEVYDDFRRQVAELLQEGG